MMSKSFVSFGIVVSFVTLLLLIFISCIITKEITHLWNELDGQLSHLKEETDDLWKSVVELGKNEVYIRRLRRDVQKVIADESSYSQSADTASEIITRIPSGCSCSNTNFCPPGPRGRQGAQGADGVNGIDGVDGYDGFDAHVMPPAGPAKICYRCPPGPPGEVGKAGDKGKRGMRGGRGQPGTPGTPGQPGWPGSIGPPGITGPDGKAGERGQNGLDGMRYIARQGVKGAYGESGPEGQPGLRGSPGFQGLPGKQGYPGLQGLQGMNGAEGHPGAAGPAGRKGEDALYCSCPQKDDYIEIQGSAVADEEVKEGSATITTTSVYETL